MLTATPSGSFQATAEGAPTGLVGTIGVRVERLDGTTAIARSTASIVEVEAGSGVYVATRTAPATSGDYIVLWDTGSGAWAQEALTVSAAPFVAPPSDIRPDLGEVGAILRARTRSDAAGGELGTFTDATRPTGDEVDEYISLAVAEVSLRIPVELSELYIPFARRLVAVRAAMYIELSFDPDRTGDGSAYERLREQFETGMAALQDALGDAGQSLTSRVASPGIISSTLAPFPDEIRALIAPPWPVP